MARLITIAACVLVLSGCQSIPSSAVGRGVDDPGITASVKSRLITDRASNLTNIAVDTDQGRVSLNGSVESFAQKARAEQIAWQVEGVKGVVNNVQVR